jgi:hypothetical protein
MKVRLILAALVSNIYCRVRSKLLRRDADPAD